MKAFIAILLVAAVSGTQFTGGLNKSLWDLIRTRNNYGTYGDRTTGYPFGTFGDHTTTYGAYGKYLQQLLNGLTSGSDYDYTTVGSFPYGGYNVPSDVYQGQVQGGYTYLTLSQLYASPIFQQYLSLPFFRQYVTYPAFQRYLVSGYFQQYYTQTVFQQFFREPALFYRYIFPVVAQFQSFGTYEPVISIPEVYRQYVPEYVYNYINNYVTKTGGVDTTTGVVGGRGYFPYGGFFGGKYNQEQVTPFNFNKYFGDKYYYNQEQVTPFNFNKYFGDKYYNQEQVTPFNFNKYFGGKYNYEQKYFGNNYYPYNYNFEGFGNGLNVNDFETIRKVLYPYTFDKTYNYKNTLGNKFGGMSWENTKKTVEGTNWENTPTTYTPTWALDKIVKDLIEGKVDINEQIKNVVNPVTGEVKLVDEKIVKPLDTTFEGEFTKDALHKVMLKKEVFNKL